MEGQADGPTKPHPSTPAEQKGRVKTFVLLFDYIILYIMYIYK